MNLSLPFIRRPVMTTLVMVAIVLLGILGYTLLPVSDLPNVDFPTIEVTASLPGANPQTMASSVATPLERQFSGIPGLDSMTSSSGQGTTQITLQFDLNRSIDAAALDVQSAIAAAGGQLPHDMPAPPTFKKVNPADMPIYFLSLNSDSLPLSQVDEYAETYVAQRLSSLSGIAQVNVYGAQKYAVRIDVDPEALLARGIGIDEVANAVQQANSSLPVGVLNGNHQTLSVMTNGQLLDAAAYRPVIVAYRNGAPVHLSDVANVIDSVEDNLRATWYNNKRGVVLAIQRQPGTNTIAVANEIKHLLPTLRAEIPASVNIKTMFDRSHIIKGSVHDVQFTLILTMFMVVFVIFLFLRSFSATLIPSLALPTSILATFGVMHLFNFNLDNLSLMALTLSTGFVVDDAIVMLENIYRYIEEGMKPMDAALKGAGEIGFTIVSISLSLIAVFIPLLLMGGYVGRLFREFAMTVSIAVMVSAVVSLTLTPMMSSRFLRHETGQHGFFYNVMEAGFDAVVRFYARTLDVALRHRFITLLVFLATMALSVHLYIAIPKGFFPEQDIGLIIGVSDGAQDVSFAEMYRRQEALNDVISADPNVMSYSSYIGPGFGGQTANNGRVYINLKPWGERKLTAQQVIEELRPKLAAVEGVRLYLQAGQIIRVGGRLSRTMYEYTLQDADLDELSEWSPKLLAKMRALPMLRDVATDQQMGGTAATIHIDRDKAASLGIQPQLIDDTLYDAFGQREVAQFFTQVNSYWAILEVPPDMAGKVATLDLLYVRTPAGKLVPLSTFARWDTTQPVALSVSHQSMFPAVTISFNLAPGAALGDAVKSIQQAELELGLPPTVQGSFQGTAQTFQSSLRSQPYLIAAALIAVYIILGVLYESYILPLTILSTLPSAGVGALLLLMLLGYPLTVMALIGIILLIGIVKKNGIMMVDFAINAERHEGQEPLAAIRQACLLRFRPILMTTLAAMLGGLPLMLATGAGSELRRPLGVTMVGGLALSQLLTLYTTPVVYLYLDRLQHWLAPKQKRQVPRLASKLGAAGD